ncbi:MAG: Calx-beta domain-containing protein [Gemmataceae bacterium]
MSTPTRRRSIQNNVRSLSTKAWDYLFGNAKPTRVKPRLGVETLEDRSMPAVYNPATAFLATCNTSGPWSYGSANTLTGTFVPGDSVALDPDVDAWGVSSLPAVFHNPSNADVDIAGTVLLHAGELALHPGPNGEYGVVRFEAPSDGWYEIDAGFGARDSGLGGTDAHVLVNGEEAFGATITTTAGSAMAPLTVHLAEGDTVDFRVGYGPNHTYYNDSTSLDATISEVDEPATPTSYSPATGFSALTNDGNPWVFGSTPTLGGTFAAGSRFDLASGIAGWGTGTNVPGAFKNLTDSTQTFASSVTLDSGELALHPGPDGAYGVARFISPADGYYQVDAHFAARDSSFGGTDAHILVNGTEVFGASVTNNGDVGLSAPLTVYLAEGDKLDFAIGWGSNATYWNDSTGLDATITPVEEAPAPAENAAGAFSPTTNPNAGWSYGWAETLTDEFVPGEAFAMAPGVAGWGNTDQWDQLPGAFKNLTDQSQTFRNTVTLGAGELALHPGAGGEYAVVEYEVEVAGEYTVSGSFAGRDNAFGGTDAHILVNGVEVFGAAITDNTGLGMPEPLTVHLNAGDTVDYRVGFGSNGSYYNDSTALDASVTLIEADASVTVVKIADAYEGGESGLFRFSRTGDSSSSLTAKYTVSGTATPGTDYTSLSGSVFFASGKSTVDVVVAVADDTTAEGTETVELALRDNYVYTVGRPSAATVRLIDDEMPSVSVRAERNTGESADETGLFVFTREGGNLAQSLSISLSVDGDATEGSDYSPLSRTVLFEPGKSTATLAVSALEDTDFEMTEYVVVRIDEGSGHRLTPDYAAGVAIADNEVGSIGGTVWQDIDEDGTLGGGDLPAADISVTLRDADGNWLGDTVTGADGKYFFPALRAGVYVIDFNPPFGFILTEAGVGSESTDSDADPFTTWSEPVTIVGPSSEAGIPAGYLWLHSHLPPGRW